MSLVEIMVAMVVLSFGLLGVAALQVRAITESSSGQHLSSASAIARNRVEELNRVTWNSALLNDSDGAWSASTNIAALDQTYARSERVAWNVATVAGVILKTIEVRVTWDDSKRLNRQVLLTGARLREVGE